jgi:endo-beta-N-acetylglucosaminidase D
MKFIFKLSVVLLSQVAIAQTPQSNIFTVDEFLQWDGSLVALNTTSTTPLAKRVVGVRQVKDSMNTDLKILYCPDGISSFVKYPHMPQKFNYFNFNHWQYIDILCWFGGSVEIPILVPSKNWIDAAHKNGVKVIGIVFFIDEDWGGREQSVIDFLKKDSEGKYLAIKQLKAMAEKYNFDGWMLHFETIVHQKTATDVNEFVVKLKDDFDGEIIWYDSMNEDGGVEWQNELTDKNVFYFENSTGMMTNYWWNENKLNLTHNKALASNRSPYDIYTGVDLWPTRNAQKAFTNNSWLRQICIQPENNTSIALYATNFTYNCSVFSNFINNPNDVARFYSAERKLISGIDENPFIFDNYNGNNFEGISAYIPVKTVITSFPFATNFNLGHGLQYYRNGNSILEKDWTDMELQDIPVTWAFKYGKFSKVSYDFEDAFNGGSSLKLSAAALGNYYLPLFSTSLHTKRKTLHLAMALKINRGEFLEFINLVAIDENGNKVYFPIKFDQNLDWQEIRQKIKVKKGLVFSEIGIEIKSKGPFLLNIGQLILDERSIKKEAYTPNEPVFNN